MILWPLTTANAIFGIILFYYPKIFLDIAGALLFSSVIGLILGVKYLRFDFIAQLRLLFMAAIGYYAAIAKYINPEMLFMDFGGGIQTLEIGVKMYALTSIAILGSLVGFAIAKQRQRQVQRALLTYRIHAPSLFWVTFFLIILVGFLSAKSYGPAIWISSYASGDAEGQLLGNLQSTGVILLGLNLFAALKLRRKFNYIAFGFAAFYFLIWGILIRGGRLEFLSGVLVIFVALPLLHGRIRTVPMKFYIYLLLFAILMEYVGYLRYALVDGFSETLLEGYIRMFDSGVFFLGTISGIASAYANVLHMIEAEVVNLKFGLPYIEYLLRTPPEFLYPGRPRDLSSIFEQYGYISIGGFFELAEAYLSFGIVGVFLIPLFISWLFSRIHFKAAQGSLLNYVLILGIISVFMRGAWYQTFAYYKSIVTAFIIYIMVILICRIFEKNASHISCNTSCAE